KAVLERSGQVLNIEVRRERGLSSDEVALWQRLLNQGQGLKPILEHLKSRKPQLAPVTALATVPAVNETMATALPSARPIEASVLPRARPVDSRHGHVSRRQQLGQPPPLANVGNVALSADDEFAFVRPKRQQKTERSLRFHLINAAGFVTFSL